jgi:hypothetical protein
LAEKEFRKAENTALRTEQLMNARSVIDVGLKREWYQTHSEKGSTKRKNAADAEERAGKKQKSNKLKKINPWEERAQKQLTKTMDFEARSAKRARKPQRTRALDDKFEDPKG